jgi:hypothetical protein
MNAMKIDRSWPSREHLIRAAIAGRKDLVELIINSGVNPNDVDESGETVLHDVVRLDGAADAVATLLPNVTELHLKNKQGYTATELALVSGREDVAQLIEGANVSEHFWWRQPKVSEAARFLSFVSISPQDRKWIVAQLDIEDAWCRVPRESCAFLTASLPFYATGSLVAIEHLGRRGPCEQFALVRMHEDFIPLNWTNEPFFEANARWETSLTEQTLPTYVRTFFHFVRGQTGRFQIVDNIGDIAWTEGASVEQKRAVESRLRSLKQLEFEIKDRAVFSAVVIFKNALFSTKILISLKDQIIALHDEVAEMSLGEARLFESELLLENLDIVIPLPASAWG